MLKKIIISTVILICGGLIIMTYTSLKETAFQTKNPIEIVPLDAAIIIESNNIRTAWLKVAETNLVYDAALNVENFAAIDNSIHKVDSILGTSENTRNIFSGTNTVVSFHAGDGIQFFAVVNAPKIAYQDLATAFSKYGDAQPKKWESHEGIHVQIANNNYYLAFLKPFVILTSDASLINKSVAQLASQQSILDDEVFNDLRATENFNSSFHLYINGEKMASLLVNYFNKSFVEQLQEGSILPNWMAFDFTEKSNAVIFTGLSTADANNTVFANAKYQKPIPSKSMWLLPTDLLSYQRVTITDAQSFLKDNSVTNLSAIEEYCMCDPMLTFGEWITDEVVTISFGNKSHSDIAYFVGCEGNPNLIGLLSNFGVSDTIYKKVYGRDVYEVRNKDFLSLIGINDTSSLPLFFARMNDFAVFSSYKGVSKIAYQWKASQASVPNNKFINFAKKMMANYSTNDAFYSSNYFIDHLATMVKETYRSTVLDLKTNFDDINGIAWQSSSTKNNLIYHSFSISTSQGASQDSPIQELWSISMQKNITTAPQVLKNHQTKTNEVFVQDEDNVIHLISATGKVKWFKPINESILGKVKQIDIYQNGKFQMLFSTATKIHLIDINGNEVKGYPIKLPAIATNEVSVFDYDKNGNYRFMIATLDKEVLNYSKEGKLIEGWQIPKTENIVINPLHHFVVEGKDYICINDLDGKIYLTNRKGEPRESISNRIHTLHKENIFLQQGTSLASTKFIFQDTTEQLTEMPLVGEEKNSNLDSTAYDFYQYTVDVDNDALPDYIQTFGNKLSIFGPDKQLFYSDIFDFDILQNIISIGKGHKYTLISDESKGEIYLYNYQFKPIQGFPKDGSIKSAIGDLNKDGHQDVITVASKNVVRAYSINQNFGL